MANAFEYPFYVLRFDRDYSAKLDGAKIADESVEEAFEVVEVSDVVIPKLCVKTAKRVADSFI